MKKLLIGVTALTGILVSCSVANAGSYRGDWYFNTDVNDREELRLGDASDNSMLVLRGTRRYCGVPGDSYDEIRSVLINNGLQGEQIEWWVTNNCNDGYVRICIENSSGQLACSTYRNEGWRR